MKVLILGGTTEASAIACALAGDRRFAPILSLAGRTRAPAPAPIPWRSGGFGGAEGLAIYLRNQAIRALIDATHPFAARMKANAAQAATIAGVPRIAVLRPAWTVRPGDRWTRVADMPQAFAALGPAPRRVFLAIGRQELAAFGPPHAYLVRSIDPPDPATLPQGATAIAARGPFTEDAECALLAAHRIEVLVTKNAGGDATAAKLAAARHLRLPVIMVARPAPPEPPVVTDAAGALDWLAHQAGLPCWRGV
jgi:precorrin-6A/cobalt-precorrin-6A reductase